MSTDNSLVIFQKKFGDTSRPFACHGSDLAGEDGMFDRHKIHTSYVRIQPGQEVPSMCIPSESDVTSGRDPFQARDMILGWVAAYGSEADAG